MPPQLQLQASMLYIYPVFCLVLSRYLNGEPWPVERAREHFKLGRVKLSMGPPEEHSLHAYLYDYREYQVDALRRVEARRLDEKCLIVRGQEWIEPRYEEPGRWAPQVWVCKFVPEPCGPPRPRPMPAWQRRMHGEAVELEPSLKNGRWRERLGLPRR